MNQVTLNGANPETVAEKMGGTLIAVNGDTALIAGGDPEKLTATKYLYEIGQTVYGEIWNEFYKAGEVTNRKTENGKNYYQLNDMNNLWSPEKNLYGQNDIDDIG